jgi:plastocyanin
MRARCQTHAGESGRQQGVVDPDHRLDPDADPAPGRLRLRGAGAAPLRAAAVAALAALAILVPGGAAAKPAPSRVQVVAKEFYYSLSRHSVPAGPAIVELVDFGQDPHDLRLQKVGTTKVYGTPIIQPGKYYDLKVTLQPGKYILWCSIANHRQLGMQATLTVKKRT